MTEFQEDNTPNNFKRKIRVEVAAYFFDHENNKYNCIAWTSWVQQVSLKTLELILEEFGLSSESDLEDNYHFWWDEDEMDEELNWSCNVYFHPSVSNIDAKQQIDDLKNKIIEMIERKL